MPLSVVQDRRARGKFKEWRDGMATNPRKADYAWTVLARVISVAKDRGLIAVNFANAAAGYTKPIARKSFGCRSILRRSVRWHRQNCNLRCCSRSGPASVRGR